MKTIILNDYISQLEVSRELSFLSGKQVMAHILRSEVKKLPPSIREGLENKFDELSFQNEKLREVTNKLYSRIFHTMDIVKSNPSNPLYEILMKSLGY